MGQTLFFHCHPLMYSTKTALLILLFKLKVSQISYEMFPHCIPAAAPQQSCVETFLFFTWHPSLLIHHVLLSYFPQTSLLKMLCSIEYADAIFSQFLNKLDSALQCFLALQKREIAQCSQSSMYTVMLAPLILFLPLLLSLSPLQTGDHFCPPF